MPGSTLPLYADADVERTTEGSLAAAEPHLLASGTRDAARILASVLGDWWESSDSPTQPGIFALRGTLPHLVNGNVRAARIFVNAFSSRVTSSPKYSPASPPVRVGDSAEIATTSDSVLNFAQLTVLACQRAQGERSKVMREAWVRLCGTYQSKGGVLAQPDVRAVRVFTFSFAVRDLVIYRSYKKSPPSISPFRRLDSSKPG